MYTLKYNIAIIIFLYKYIGTHIFKKYFIFFEILDIVLLIKIKIPFQPFNVKMK